MPKTPTKRTPPRNKNEISPNNRSKCHRCGIKIMKGEQRYGVVESNDYGRIQRYYHPKCCPESAKRKIGSLEDSTVLKEHSELHENLRLLRRLFAEKLEVEPFRIFHDRSLEELVTNMPTTESQLLDIWGIKEKKVYTFGSSILAVIQQYKAHHLIKNQHHLAANRSVKVKKEKTKRTSTTAARPAKKRRRKQALESVEDKDDNTTVEVGETLTCEEIVAQKFKHAQENGYMITIS